MPGSASLLSWDLYGSMAVARSCHARVIAFTAAPAIVTLGHARSIICVVTHVAGAPVLAVHDRPASVLGLVLGAILGASDAGAVGDDDLALAGGWMS